MRGAVQAARARASLLFLALRIDSGSPDEDESRHSRRAPAEQEASHQRSSRGDEGERRRDERRYLQATQLQAELDDLQVTLHPASISR